MASWHYQLMRHKQFHTNDHIDTIEIREHFMVHEYYPAEDGDSWTSSPITIGGDTIEEVKTMLRMIENDIYRHGVKDYEG